MNNKIVSLNKFGIKSDTPFILISSIGENNLTPNSLVSSSKDHFIFSLQSKKNPELINAIFSKANVKILIVDDDYDEIPYQYYLRKYYKIPDENILCVSDPTEVMDALYQHQFSPDFIISDLYMQDMNGDEFLQGIMDRKYFNK